MSIVYQFKKSSILIKVITFGEHINEMVYSVICHITSDPTSDHS